MPDNIYKNADTSRNGKPITICLDPGKCPPLQNPDNVIGKTISNVLLGLYIISFRSDRGVRYGALILVILVPKRTTLELFKIRNLKLPDLSLLGPKSDQI